jgi:hypothetical protein
MDSLVNGMYYRLTITLNPIRRLLYLEGGLRHQAGPMMRFIDDSSRFACREGELPPNQLCRRTFSIGTRSVSHTGTVQTTRPVP